MFRYLNLFTPIAAVLAALLMCSQTTHAQLPAYLPTDGLVGWWPFNGNANDESGNGNDGVVNGATLTEDRYGNANRAFHFDGFSEIQTQAPGPTGSGISLSFWYKSNDLNQMQTISYGSANWGHYFGAYLNHYSAQTPTPCYGPSFTNAGTLVNKNTGIIIDTTLWHHAVIIIPDVAPDLNSVIFYLDGNLLGGNCSFANYGAPSPNIDGGNPIKIGAGWYSGFPYNNFNGELDDIAFFDRALSVEEITALYNGDSTNSIAECNQLSGSLQNGLVGYWPFCGNANDESGNGNDGVVNGAVLTQDRFGNPNRAYAFDGVNSYITTTPLLDASQNFTFSCWVNSNSNSDQTILNTIPHTIIGYDLNPWWGGPGNIGFLYGTGLSFGWLNPNYYFPNPNPSENNWINHIIVKDGFNWKFYQNGVLVQNYLATSNPSNTLAQLVFGHCDPSICSQTLSGSLDDIIMWNRALTQEEITSLYTGEPINPPAACNPLPTELQNGLVGYWPFCGNANDESGNGNDGVVNGAVLTQDRFGNSDAAYAFDGINDLIDIGNLDNTSTFSISFWHKRTIDTLLSYPIGLGINNLNSIDVFKGYGIGIGPNSSDVCGLNPNQTFANDGLFTCENIVGNSNSNLDNWEHVILLSNGESAALYFNGELSDFSNSIQIPGIQNLTIGTRSDLFAYYTGNIDDVITWNRTLTEAEIQELFTLDACTFTVYDTAIVNVYDTLTVYNTIDVYDTLTVYNNIDVYDTLTVYNNIDVYDTLTVYNNIDIYDTLAVYNNIDVYDTLTVYNNIDVYDTLTVYNNIDIYDTLTVYNTIDVYDTLTVYNNIDLYDTLTVYNNIDVYDTTYTNIPVYDTLTVYNTIDLYDTTYVTVYDTLYTSVFDTTYVTIYDTLYTSVTDTLIIDITLVGIPEPDNHNNVLIYPNPASDHITIDYGNFASMAGYQLTITNALGQTVFNTNINAQQSYIDINSWGALGIYYVTISDATGNPVTVKKIVLE